jgi:hypothetical protein
MLSETHDSVLDEVLARIVYIPNADWKKRIDEMHEYRRSVEFQSAYVIYEKYKRKFNLDIKNLRELEMEAYHLSKARKEKGKTPNVDYLSQELSKFLKNKYKETQKQIEEPCY